MKDLIKLNAGLSKKELFLKFLNRGKPPCDYERQLLKKHSQRIKAIFEGKIIPPYEVEIQPTSECNLNCRHCFGKALTHNKIKNRINEPEIETIAKRINEFKENGFQIEVAKFCGTTGEPLLNPATLYGIELFKSQGKKVILFTNGLALDNSYQGRPYLDYVSRVDELVVSLDAASEETFEKLKGRIGFNKIKRSLEQLSLQSIKHTVISYVISPVNYHEIITATELAKYLKANEIRFRVDFTNPEEIKKISSQILRDLKETEKYEEDEFKVIQIYSEDEISEDSSAFNSIGRKCYNQHFWACIGPDANLYACGHRTYAEVQPYGNLLENSFKKLWTSEKRLKILKSLPDEHCKYCSPSSSRRNTFMTFLESFNLGVF